MGIKNKWGFGVRYVNSVSNGYITYSNGLGWLLFLHMLALFYVFIIKGSRRNIAKKKNSSR